MNSFANFFRSFGVGRMMIMLGVAMGVAATLAFTVLSAGSKDMGLLFSGLDLKEASSVTAALDQAGVKYKSVGDGSTIMVERDKVLSTRTMIAGKGLVTSGSIGYEIFDSTNALGQTDFQQQVNLKRALQGELERDIKSLNGVTFAKVLLNVPQRQQFEDATSDTTGSVIVGYTREPDASQVHAIQNLVALATPGLKPDHVVVTDQQTGKTLAGGGDTDSANAEMIAQQTEKAMEQRVKQVIEPIVGVGNVRVSVTADVDKTQTTTHDLHYDPDGQVQLSSSTSDNKAQNGSATPGGPTSATGNLPGAASDSSSGSSSNSTDGASETVNFQNSKIEKTSVIEPGKINRLSVAVAVDGYRDPPGKDGKAGAWHERSADDLKKIRDLTIAAVNAVNVLEPGAAAPDAADTSRHDVVNVQNMKFDNAAANVGPAAKTSLLSGFGTPDIMRIGELVVLLIVAALTIFFVARPLLKGIGSGGGPMPMLAGAGAGGGDPHVLSGPSGPMSAQLAYDPSGGNAAGAAIAAAQAQDRGIDIARIEGQVKASAVKQVSDFVDRHPDESVSILRSWLHDA